MNTKKLYTLVDYGSTFGFGLPVAEQVRETDPCPASSTELDTWIISTLGLSKKKDLLG